MKNDIIKIQSISDIITNSSSEVYLIDLNSAFDVDFAKLIGLYDEFTLFKEEKEVEDYFKKVVLQHYDDTLNLFGYGGEGGEPFFTGNLSIEAICFYLDTNEDSDCPDELRLDIDKLWEKYKPKILEKLLSYGFIYYDRDYMFELTEKYKDEIHRLKYKLVNEKKYSIEDKIEFFDKFGNVLKINDAVYLLDLEDSKPVIKIAKITGIDILEEGGYNIIFTIIKEGKLTSDIKKVFIKGGYIRIDSVFTSTPETIIFPDNSEIKIHKTLTGFYDDIRKHGYKKEYIDKLYGESCIFGYESDL